MPRELKTILCPTDFSASSKHAIEYALHWARISDATIILAHAVHIATEHLRDEAGHLLGFDQIRERANKELQAVRTAVLGDYPRCEMLVEPGDPYNVVMNLVKTRKVDLIVTSTRGRSDVGHLLIGSVAEKIVRHATCPVLVIPTSAG